MVAKHSELAFETQIISPVHSIKRLIDAYVRKKCAE